MYMYIFSCRNVLAALLYLRLGRGSHECVCVCTFVCMMLQMCLYNLLCFRLSYSMQLSEHRIFTAIDFHHLSVQQHKSYLSDAFTTDSR